MTTPRSSTYRDLAEENPPLSHIAVLLRSDDEGVVHAAVLHVEARLRGGEALDGLPSWRPTDLVGMPPESQLVLAALALDGFPVPAPEPTATLPPLVRLAWVRARLLAQPETLRAVEATPLGWEAVSGLPPARVVSAGLLLPLVESAYPNVRARSIDYLRAGFERGLLSRSATHALALALARDSSGAIAIEAMRFLGEAWAFGIPLPKLSLRAEDFDFSAAVIALLGARREVRRVRKLLSEQEAPATLTPHLVDVLGQIGDETDIGLIAGEILRDPGRLGPSGLAALLALKRRGVSANEEETATLVEVFLGGPALDVAEVAEVLSSRSDWVVATRGTLTDPDVPWARVVALLEAFGTQRAIRRLETIVQREEERAGWWFAILALGRQGIVEAENAIVERLDAEPDACLAALRHIGGDKTVQSLRARLSDAHASWPRWASDAANLLFQLAPSTDLFTSLSTRGLLTSDILGALPAHGSIVVSTAMHDIVSQAAHPLRIAAIQATGRVGGPLAIARLRPLLSEADDKVRAEALDALRTLGTRLQAQGATRPAELATASDPGEALVADTLLTCLRDRSMDAERTARLLDAFAGLHHPQLVPVIRPYLRHPAPAIRKRAIACLAAAGPAAAPWLLPWLLHEDITLARQVLLALTRIRATGLAAPIATWLDQPNMNLKKAAAEALAVSGDATVWKTLLDWVSGHDNPGFRALLITALRQILKTSYRAVVLDRLVDTADPHAQGLLLGALEGQLSAAEVADIVQVHGAKGVGDVPWTARLLQKIFAGDFSFREGSLTTLEMELRRRGLGDRIPETALESEGNEAWRAPALRAGAALRLALRESPTSDLAIADLLAALRKANVAGQLIAPRLSRRETYALLDVYARLGDEARAGALQILASNELDAVSRLRVARLLLNPPDNEVPTGLMTCRTDSMSADFARSLTDWPEPTVREAACRALLLEEQVNYTALADATPSLIVREMIRRGAFDLGLAWCRERGQIPLLVQTMRALCGSAMTLQRLRTWGDLAPDLIGLVLPEIAALGEAGEGELVRIAKSTSVPLGLREQALTALGRRTPLRASAALLRGLLQDDHAVVREQAATQLLGLGHAEDRPLVIEAFLQGQFRQSFSIDLEHQDLTLLAHAVSAAEGASALALVRLLGGMDGPPKVPLLMDLWEREDSMLKAACRDALRRLDPSRVLPFVHKALDEGQAESLDVLRASSSVPRALAARFVAGDATWERFLARMAASGGVLHAPGLAEALVLSLQSPAAGPNAVSLLACLSEWSDPRKIPHLEAALQPRLAGRDRAPTLAQVLVATTPLDATIRAQVLCSVGQPGDRAIVAALVDAVLENTAIRDLLPAAMAAAVDREMATALGGEPERVRRILTYRALRAKTEVERVALTDALESSMGHTSARVRRHAHRLLRTHAGRSRYLAATRPLLRDPDASTVRSAIRVLTFGGELDAVPEIAALLSHPQSFVRKAARDGLLYLGAAAVPSLTKAMGRARPDRREAQAEVLDAIQRRLAVDAPDEDEEEADA